MYLPQNNSLTVIAGTSMALGLVVGLCLVFAVDCPAVAIFITSICVYHLMEFVQTARFQPSRVKTTSFLIWGNRGNREFMMVQLLSLWEYLWSHSRFAPHQGYLPLHHPLAMVIGCLCIVSGQSLRSMAMATCGESFSHLVETTGNSSNRLVTTGVYSLTRHPSYLGFWLWVVGTQLVLCNHICLVAGLVALHFFFSRRISFEEWFLVNRIYGQPYVEYSERVWVWIPFVWVRSTPRERPTRSR
ncbi:protein-S-isoprenylcysteine O-methyltransferase [[Candida] anglica]